MYAQILYINGHLKTMRLTMNSEVSVSNKANNLFSWLTKAAKTISAVFTKKEQFAIDKNLSEAIACIEWRTCYDQKRIVRYIYTASFQKDNPELYRALNMSLPIKHFWSDEVNIEITDNSFERRLVRFFGDLNPATKQLIDGKLTKNQRWVKKNARITELYLNSSPMQGASTLNGYEQQMLNDLITTVATVCIPTAPVLLLPRTVTDLVQSEEIEAAAIEVVAETLPLEKTVVLKNTTPLTDTELAKLRQAVIGKTSINKLTIEYLKLYAKARRIRIPGSVTKIRAMKEIVAIAQNGSTRIAKV